MHSKRLILCMISMKRRPVALRTQAQRLDEDQEYIVTLTTKKPPFD